jgi:hypothetical protein
MQSNAPLVDRMIRAARLDVMLYEEVEADLTATSQAATVVGIVAVCGGLGNGLGQVIQGHPGLGVGLFIYQIIVAFVAWIAWSYITFWVGTSIFKGTATPGEMLRTIGFAQSPGVLNILAFIPVVGGIVGFVAGIWALISGIIAIRQALDITTGQAVITAIIGAIPLFLLICLSGTVLAILSGAGA